MTPYENPELDLILSELPALIEKNKSLRDILLANLAIIGETPSPTFKEENRIRLLLDRFTELGLSKTSIDEMGNGVAVIDGQGGDNNLMIVAHADTIVSEKINHNYTITPDEVIGPGVADNSLGVAVLATLPYILQQIDYVPQNNIILVAATRSLGRGNLEGLRFFLANSKLPVKQAISVEGVRLGRLSHKSIGMLRGEITCKIPEQYDWSRFGSSSAILTLNEVINKINDIRLPKRPKSSIVMGTISGGNSFNSIATTASLRFEIRSESVQLTREIAERIDEITAEVTSGAGETVRLDTFASREPGGIPFSHPLVRSTRKIIQELGVEPRLAPSTSELAAFIDYNVPAITLGITEGEHLGDDNESIRIEPIYKGLAQLIAVIKAIDGGICE
ncbi:MAG: M20/M25/M40 family metallo-hydrolase [Balneolales bacterium]|nr:M20/M25/M40 family metallo-hydrolase [Balneolales bacterium]